MNVGQPWRMTSNEDHLETRDRQPGPPARSASPAAHTPDYHKARDRSILSAKILHMSQQETYSSFFA